MVIERSSRYAVLAAVLGAVVVLIIPLTVPLGCTVVQERQVAIPVYNGKISGEPVTAGRHWHNLFFGDHVVYDTGFITFTEDYSAKSLHKQELNPVPITVTHRLVSRYAPVVHSVDADYETNVIKKHLSSLITNWTVRYNIDELHENKEAIQRALEFELQRLVNEDLPNNRLTDDPLRVITVLAPTLPVGHRTEEVPDGVDDSGEPKTKPQRYIILNEVEQQIAEPVVVIEKLVITDWGFSKVIRDRIEAKQEAIQRAEQRRNEVAEAQAQADKDIATARGELETAKLRADAEAYQIEAVTRAELERIRQLGAAYAENPLALQAEWIRRWDGRTPSVLAGPDPGLAFILPDDVRDERDE